MLVALGKEDGKQVCVWMVVGVDDKWRKTWGKGMREGKSMRGWG